MGAASDGLSRKRFPIPKDEIQGHEPAADQQPNKGPCPIDSLTPGTHDSQSLR